MNVDEWLAKACEQLEKADISTARLDCLVLLEDATGKDRGWLLAHPELTVQGSTLYSLNRFVARRARHEPLAYIRGKSEFYGREFMVSADTLQPRPESETIIDLLKASVSKDRPWKQLRVVDVGTGSGCLGITVKLEVPEAEIVAIDISDKCLKTAKQNGKKLDADIRFLRGNLLEPLSAIGYTFDQLRTGQLSAIVANLPYVPDSHTINKAAMHEPGLAIFGGNDGLDLYRRLFDQIANFAQKPNYVFTESLPFQHSELFNIASSGGYNLKQTEDFIQVFEMKN